jgi:hypothetical protein
MVSLNVKNLNKLIVNIFIFILGITLLLGVGYIVRYMHILNFNSIPQGGYLCFVYPFVGMLFTVALFFSVCILYVIIMTILSLIVNFLWKRNIIEFTCDSKKIGFFEKILRHIWLFLD